VCLVKIGGTGVGSRNIIHQWDLNSTDGISRDSVHTLGFEDGEIMLVMKLNFQQLYPI